MSAKREESRASYGGSQLTLKCPSCGNEVQVIDRSFTRYGPVRCGACGADLRDAATASERGPDLRGEPPEGRRRS